eukprot:4940_1
MVKIISSSRVERRIRAEPKDYDEKKTNNHEYNYKNAIYNIVQLRMQFAFGNCLGSGVIIHHTSNRAFALTVAHNIVFHDENDYTNVIYAKNIWVSINKNEKNGFHTLSEYDCVAYHVHPKYI